MAERFTSWEKSGFMFDPISEDRRKGPSYKGASRKVLWEVFDTITAIENLNRTQLMVWRGHSDSNWELKTTLQRYLESLKVDPIDSKSFQNSQRQLILDARTRGIGFTEHGIQSTLNTYMELQHYGVPTHLLDVTEDALTALWFACQTSSVAIDGKTVESDGMLFAIDVSKMKFLTNDINFKAYNKLLTTTSEKITESAYIRSYVQNRRVSAQRAAFILSPHPVPKGSSGVNNFVVGKPHRITLQDVKAINGVKKRTKGQPRKIPFIAIRIPRESKDWILKMLESGDKRNHAKLFPDVLGMADSYRNKLDSV